jgi:hypothetical protein
MYDKPATLYTGKRKRNPAWIATEMTMSRMIAAPLFELSSEKTDVEVMRKEWVPLHREESPEPTQCPCGKNGIVELCWIRNVVTGHTLFVGNCCVKFVAEKGYCAKCELYPVVSHAAHYCQFCGHNRRDAPTGFVTKGKPLYGPPIVGLSYTQAYIQNKPYANYILDTPKTWKYNDPHYIQFLQLNRERNAAGPPAARPKRKVEFPA